MRVSKLSLSKSLCSAAVLFVVAGFQPSWAETRPASDVFLKLGEVNANQLARIFHLAL